MGLVGWLAGWLVGWLAEQDKNTMQPISYYCKYPFALSNQIAIAPNENYWRIKNVTFITYKTLPVDFLRDQKQKFYNACPLRYRD